MPLTQEQKAVAVLRALAERVAKGEAFGICEDGAFGSATITRPDGVHTHIGNCYLDTPDENFAAFVESLHELFCSGVGLSWASGATAHQHSRCNLE